MKRLKKKFRLATNALFFVSFSVNCLAGCSSSTFLPSSKDILVSQWKSYEHIYNAFQEITPYQTDIESLKKLGFSPEITPNIQILNHLDILQKFLPNPSIKITDLDQGLQDCLAAQEECYAYDVVAHHIDSERHGNVLLDVFNFHRKTNIKGWEFRAIIVLKKDLVVYKICGGKPKIDEFKDQKNPLGPLQQPDRIIGVVTH